jgi:hypothetical protein
LTVSSNVIVSLDLALLRLGDRVMRRLFAENTRCLASLYASETYAMADESGARRARYWIPAEAEMRGIKDLVSYLWFMVWAVTLGGGSAILTITPTAAEAYLRVVFTAGVSVALTMSAIHGPIDGMSRRWIHDEVFVAHTLSDKVFAAIWLINCGWLYPFLLEIA